MNKAGRKLDIKLVKYLYWPFIYILFFVVMTWIALLVNHKMGYLFLGILVFSILLFGVVLRVEKTKMMREVVNFAIDFSSIQKDFLKYFDLPIIILDYDGKVRWSNRAFDWMVSEKKILDRCIKDLIPEFDIKTLPLEHNLIEKEFTYKDLILRAVVTKYSFEDQPDQALGLLEYVEEQRFYSVFFFDITRELTLQRENEDQKVVAGLLYIDNYDEVINSIEDVRRPLLIALIDRHVNKFGNQMDAIIKKFEKDKYLLLFKKKYVAQLKESKFSILDEIREINLGNELPVTASIGLGLNEDTYQTALEYAQMSIDLALGRGGDQAVIKKKDKFSFYGGKSKAVEKSTRVKARIKAYAFRELLEECSNVIVMGHKFQDLDSLGAAIGVYACAKQLDKTAHIVINDITSATRLLYDRVVQSEHYPEDLFLNSSQVAGYIDESTLVVVVDVNRPSYMEFPAVLDMTKNVVVFDHHRVSADYIENPVLSYIESYASSTCEMITEILRYISEKVKLDPIEADALFAGISVDTKNFVVKTGVKTFEAAAFLRRNGADVIRVRKLFKNDMESYKAKATAVKDSIVYKDVVALAVCPSNVANATLVAAQAADELLGISGIKASFVLSDINGTVYISARSLDDINVQFLMEKLGGGGHLSVAGAQLPNTTIEEGLRLLKMTIDEHIQEGEKE
ncbi:DHH family phosphoesterase [Anaerotalea alkaliphila]|uniref:Cyclic-di-AMP phosphodiesterase n=1 Tax=Anaerotalea alkaliphila TaxID=2662126 RepID=A0A7X5HU40_9FIRM|nr:DHH family phosphoesterase [Anaerotalea alkaliphila]NDL66688.1 DHH family phosphoesterase [Anaerotalea alkaliphila]